jgi:DNA-binding GntR family transcriptional regulator
VSSTLTKPLKCDHGLRRQALVGALLADVFHGRLRAGQHLVAQELAVRFGVSQTPIREALIELGGIGIVDLLPNRGAVVRHVTTKEVREICQVRRALECEATRRACGRMDLDELAALADELRRLIATASSLHGSPSNGAPASANGRRGAQGHTSNGTNGRSGRFMEQARAVDSRLHDLIADSCGNAFLAKELARLKTLFRAFRDVAYTRNEERNDYRRLADEAKEHLAIVEPLLAGDRLEAARAMARHIRTGARYWSRALAAASNGSADARFNPQRRKNGITRSCQTTASVAPGRNP